MSYRFFYLCTCTQHSYTLLHSAENWYSLVFEAWNLQLHHYYQNHKMYPDLHSKGLKMQLHVVITHLSSILYIESSPYLLILKTELFLDSIHSLKKCYSNPNFKITWTLMSQTLFEGCQSFPAGYHYSQIIIWEFLLLNQVKFNIRHPQASVWHPYFIFMG